MKKLMIVAMVAMAAVAANAAKVTWGVKSGTFEKISAGTMYLVWAESANFSGLDQLEKFDASTIGDIGGTVVGDSVAYNGGGQTAVTVVKPGDPVKSMTQGPKKLYTMLISSDGKEFAYSAVTSQPILNNENTADISKTAGTFTVIDAATPGPDPTPEPTTGMLMLVGLAGLALRRRRA